MKFTIDSRKIGRAITFSRPGSEYIYMDQGGRPGTLGEQICKGNGSTIGYGGDDHNEFEKICRRWYNHTLLGE